jgi:hypothetical protein
MDKYIYENNCSISPELCDEIIKLYEEEKLCHFAGRTYGGVNKNIKDTTDFLIPHNLNNEENKWYKIENFLYKEMNQNLHDYLNTLNNKESYKNEINHNKEYKILAGNLHFDYFMIQKYKQNEGKYIYHDDFFAEFSKNRYRVITYIWYLNDVEEGGETEFWGDYKIKPKKGKLVFFPACWCFPHTGKMPISSDKYIITGWFYKEGFEKNEKKESKKSWTFTKNNEENNEENKQGNNEKNNEDLSNDNNIIVKKIE